MIKGAIFDLDGTLLDSMFIWDTIGETYLRSFGYEPKGDINNLFQSFSLYQAACYYKSEYGVSMSAEELMEGINKMVEDFYFHKVKLKKGVKEFLQKLSNKGVKMCIATATDRYQAEAVLKRCGVAGYFLKIFTCTEVGHGKDEPMIYREALKYLGTDKNETFVFEDAFYAIKTAKTEGFITVGVYDDYEKQQDKVKAATDYYIADYAKVCF